MFQIDTLIVIACHGIYLGGPTHGLDESEWLIEPFQKGETPTYIEHISRGVEELVQSQGTALLTFSGGATKRAKSGGTVTRTEADGYMDIALQHEMFGFEHDDAAAETLRHCMFPERFATDSYQNVLLSLIQFPLWLRRQQRSLGESKDVSLVQQGKTTRAGLVLPKRLVIISHEFKRARFMDLHVPAVRSVWPHADEMQVEFIGVNPPFGEEELMEVEEGERKRGYGLWKEDLFGVGKVLSQKRRERSWDEDEFLAELLGEYDEGAMEVVRQLLRGVKS